MTIGDNGAAVFEIGRKSITMGGKPTLIDM